MQTTQITAEGTFQHHLSALGNNDMEELMKDYTEQSEIWTPEGAIVGLKAITSFYAYIFTLFPKDESVFEIKKTIANAGKVYIVWTANSPTMIVSFATDCFEITDGKILWQTTAAQMTPK